MNNKRVSGALLLAALFATAPPVQAQQDASQATPPSGKTLVFVFRSDRQPVAAQVPVVVNLVRIGDLANGTFAVATVNPGRTFLRIGEQAVAVFTLEAVANRSYFVRIEAVSSVRPVRTEVRLVSETDGRRALAQSRLVGAAPAVGAAPRVQPPAPIAAPPRAAPPPVAAAPRAQPSPPRPAPSAEAGADWNFALIAKGGAFKLASANQTARRPRPGPTWSPIGRPRVSSGRGRTSPTARPTHGSCGPGPGGDRGSRDVLLLDTDVLIDIQRGHAPAVAWFGGLADMPSVPGFVGVGVGYADALYSGDLKGTAGGAAFQGMAGMEFRFVQVGVLLQYKHLAATTGQSGSDVKIGGSGVLAGVSIAF